MLEELLLGKQRITTYPNEIIDILRLIRSENVGPRTFHNLLKIFKNAKTALENIEEFSLRGGKSKPIKVYSINEANKELELLAKNNAKIITFNSPEYSRLLLQIPDFPPVLSYKGNIKLFDCFKNIAIVGARNASMNGCFFASKIAKELVECGYIVSSGLARGIDTSVHQVAHKHTIAVIAGGIDHIYPYENKKLYEQIASDGLIIAELPIGTKALGQHFPQRNRLISGLSIGTVIIEANLHSGSLITAKYALEQNREVFAVPGFPLDPRAQGTNKLIKEGAHLLESVEDIIANIPDRSNYTTSSDTLFSINDNFKTLDINYLTHIDNRMRIKVKNLLSTTPIDLESVMDQADLPPPIIHMIILEFELAGNIIRNPGNKISLVYK